MDEKLNKLYTSLSSKYNMPEFDAWKASLSDPEKLNKAYRYAKENFNNVGTIDEFKSDLFPSVKKKVSSKGSAFDWETGSIDVQKLSSTQPTARTAGEKFKYSWGGGKTEELASAPYSTSEISAEIQDSPQTAALKNIRQRRGTDYSSSAADIAKGRIDAAGKRTSTPLESLHSAASQMSFGDWLDESPSSYNTDQRTAAEFNAFSKALSDENREIGLAIKGIESKMKLDYGTDMDDYGAMVLQFNTLQTSAKKLVDGFEKLPDNKKTQEEADRINAEIDKIQEQAAELQGRLDEFSSTPEFDEISKLYELSNINTKKYEDEIKTGKYDHAKQFGKYLEYRQSLKDEAFKKMTPFDKLVSATGSVILHTLAKVPQSVASLSDVIEKSVGMEGEKNTAGDVVQDILIGLGDDIQAAFPAPTKLQRGGFTDTAKWGEYQVDFTADGEIQAIRDKDGYLQKTMLSEQQQSEIKSLKKERQFNSQSFAYQTGSTIADVGVQILGTKGVGGIKALPGVVGTSWGLPRIGMKSLGTQFGMIATTAGMMSNDLYQEGLENGLSEDDAARYALSTGTVIGLVGTLAGVGIEEQLLLKSKLPSIGLRNKMPGFVGRKAYDLIKGGAGEFTEEIILEKLGQAGVQYAMNEMAGGKFDIEPYKDTTAIINEAATAVVAGGLFSLFKSGKKANGMQRSMLADGAKDIPKTIEMVKEVAAAAGQPLTIAEEAELKQELEVTQKAIEKIPEEQKTNPEVVETMVEKTKVDEEISAKKEEIKAIDPAFQQDAKNEIAALEVKSAELAIKVAEQSGVTPDEKAVKLLEPKEGEQKTVSSGTVAKEGEVLATEPVLEPAAKKQTEPSIPQQPKTLDELASLPDTDLSNMSDEQVVAKVLKEGSPAQVGQAWLVEPDVVQGEIFTKEAAIEDAVLNSTFSIEALQGTPDVSKKYLPKEGRKAQVVDLAELAEELSDQTGMNITEADIADYIRANPEKKKPKKMKANPNKRLLAQRYKDLTGKLPRVEEVEKLSERSRFLKEKQAVESEFPEAADVRPARPASDKIEKSLMNRVATDPLVPLEVREMAKAGKLDYEVLKDEHVNEVAEFEIRQNMATMDLSDGLAASVKTAKDLLKESVDTDSELSREVNGAVATSIILKVAFNYAENGMMKEAHELYDWLDSYSRGIGRSISSLRANASPEGVAGRTAVRVFETQVRELSKKGKNATLDQMLKDLRKEIEKARDGSNMKAAKETAAKVISGKKKDLKAERSEILAKIKAQIFDQSLGAVYDPEQQAEKAAQLISNVRLLIRNLVESGVTKVQEVYDNVVESLKSVGFSDDDADRVAKDALLASNGKPLGTLPSGKAQKLMEVPLSGTVSKEQIESLEPLGTLPSGKAQKLMEVPLSGTVSKEQIESLEPLGTLPSGQQGTLIDVPTTTKSKVPTEHVESDVKKPDMADATGPQQTIEQQTDEDGNVIDFSPKASGPMFKTQQAMIEDVVDEHYKNSDGRALWVKLKEIGLPESDARKYEQALTSELLKKEKAAIVRAVENFKQKVREEEVEGIIIHESRWNGSVDAIVAAAAKGLLNDQSLAAAVAGYFGFVSITPQDVADIKAISSNIIEGVGSNAVVGPDGDILGYQPIGIPAPTGTTLSPVNQKSPELLARAQKEMKIKLLEMEKRNEGIMPILAGELGFMMHAGALANTGTWLNVIVGTLTKLAPDLISLSVSNPVAAVRAVQEISKSKAKNWKMGWGVLRGAFKDNFSHMENEQTQLDGQYVNTVSLMEVAMIRGLSKYSKMYADATGIDKAKSFGKLVGAVLLQAYRVAIAPKAIDAQFAHPVTEFVRFIETFNKMSNGLKFAETVTPEFAKKVSEYGMFTQKAWDIAKSQAAAEVAGMKASGKKVPFDFETRRAKEIIQQQVRREEIRSAQLFMDQASLRGEMTGFLGVAYDSFMHSGVQTKRPPLLEVTRTIVMASIAMFMRVAIHGANIVQKTTPLLSPIINATSHVLVNRTLAGALSSKYVGEKVMKEYPVDRQIGNGYVRKSATENAKDFGEQAMSMFILATLAMSMFDRDDEDNLILDPDRWIDISASLDNSPFTNEVGGMTRYSVRFRQSDGSWGKPKKFSLWLPFAAPLAIIGGLRDDIMFRNEEFQKKSPLARGGASLNDVIGVFGEVSFNSLGQTIARFGKAQSAAAKSDTPMPWVDVTFETLLRPTKAGMPGVYRDLMVNELGVMLDEPAKKPDKWYEKVAKDLPWIDYYIKGDRFDEYGNLIYRDSKLGKMVERVSMGFVDFTMKNEETRNRPEWKLSSKFESLITPGQYFPSRSLKRTSDGEEFGVKKGEKITDEVRMEMSRRVAERKGLIVNEYYEELNDMDKQSLEQMFEKIHNFAGEAIKFEMGYSKESKEPKFSFKKANKSIKESDED